MTHSVFLPINADDARKTISQLDAKRWNVDLVAIPAHGGCVVAVIPHAKPAHSLRSLTDRFRMVKQEREVRRVLTALSPPAWQQA